MPTFPILRRAESSSHCHVFNLNRANPVPPVDSSTSSRPQVLRLEQLEYSSLFQRDNSSARQARKIWAAEYSTSSQCTTMCLRQNYPPGDAFVEDVDTKKLAAHLPTQPSATKFFQQILLTGFGVPKVLIYRALTSCEVAEGLRMPFSLALPAE